VPLGPTIAYTSDARYRRHCRLHRGRGHPRSSTQARLPATAHAGVAGDPDVLGAERMFSAWMEAQIAYRVLPFVDARGMAAATGVTSNLEDMAKFVSAQFRKGPRGGVQVVSTGSLREMHRVRSVEQNWTSGTGLGVDITRIKDGCQ